MSADVTVLPDQQQQSEAQIAAAIERLREDMPRNFILVYQLGEGEAAKVQTIAACSLKAAQMMLPLAIDQISGEFAVRKARNEGAPA